MNGALFTSPRFPRCCAVLSGLTLLLIFSANTSYVPILSLFHSSRCVTCILVLRGGRGGRGCSCSSPRWSLALVRQVCPIRHRLMCVISITTSFSTDPQSLGIKDSADAYRVLRIYRNGFECKDNNEQAAGLSVGPNAVDVAHRLVGVHVTSQLMQYTVRACQCLLCMWYCRFPLPDTTIRSRVAVWGAKERQH